MKKLSLLLVASAFVFAANAQDAKPAGTTAKATTTAANPNTAAHVCTAACKDGKHVYAHGEKGHVCTDACKKTKSDKK
jgi:hypothetical protein